MKTELDYEEPCMLCHEVLILSRKKKILLKFKQRSRNHHQLNILEHTCCQSLNWRQKCYRRGYCNPDEGLEGLEMRPCRGDRKEWADLRGILGLKQ